MKAPYSENVYDVTAPMLEVLHQLLNAEPHAVNIANMKTAVALVNRGWVMRSEIAARLDTRSTYFITRDGRKAYNIAKRMAGVV